MHVARMEQDQFSSVIVDPSVWSSLKNIKSTGREWIVKPSLKFLQKTHKQTNKQKSNHHYAPQTVIATFTV